MSALFSAEVPQLGPLGMLSAQLSVAVIGRKTRRLSRGAPSELICDKGTLGAHVDFIIYALRHVSVGRNDCNFHFLPIKLFRFLNAASAGLINNRNEAAETTKN